MKVPTGGIRAETRESPRALAMGKVSRVGRKPTPTVTVRIRENMSSKASLHTFTCADSGFAPVRPEIASYKGRSEWVGTRRLLVHWEIATVNA